MRLNETKWEEQDVGKNSDGTTNGLWLSVY